MRDLQSRLGSAGHETAADRPGVYGSATEAAVRSFQERRGLRIDGICGPQTWGSLVEAGYRLGDRLLYHRSPPLRGDDVAELQRRLGALGFDAGRVDGIFGEDTQRAVLEFQRNAGLTGDAVCGPATLAVLGRVKARNDDPIPVAAVHEGETLRHSPRTLRGRRVVVAHAGGLDALTDAIVRALAETGAHAVPLHHLDGSAQAQQANGVGADVFVGLVVADDGCSVAYYAAHGFESRGGRRLAECIQKEVPAILRVTAAAPTGMALPVLRETRMPAVLCDLGPPSTLVAKGAELARAFTRALECWVQALDDI